MKNKRKALGLFLSLGESFTDLKKTGQDRLMVDEYIAQFCHHFQKVYVFTYQREKITLPKNAYLVQPPIPLHRYIYALLLPVIHRSTISNLDILRCYQLSGVIPALIAKMLFKKKVVFNLGYDYAAFAAIEGKPLQSLLFKLLQPIAIQLADKIIVKTKTLHIAKGVYIPNGVNIKKFSPLKTKKTIDILFVGRLEPQKNLLPLIRAIFRMKPKPSLTTIGNGSLYKIISKHSTVHSKIPNSQLPNYYRQTKIFVLPSLKEGSPKVLLEAMSTGLPCIASDIAEHREIITHNQNGILVTPTATNIKAALEKLLTSVKLRTKIGRHARQTIISQFNQKKLIRHEMYHLQNP